jgi:hypothetical protein
VQIRSDDDADPNQVPYEDEWWPDYYTAALSRERLILPPSSQTTAVRAEVMQEVGAFTSANVNFEDADLWMKLGEAPGFVHLKAPPLAVYQKHGSGISDDARRVYEGLRHLISKEEQGKYPGRAEYEKHRRKIITIYTRSKSLEIAENGLLKEAWEIYRNTLEWNIEMKRWKYIALAPLAMLLKRTGGHISKQ